MGLQGSTKARLAETLQGMLQRMPLEKVRVEELCRECGADRRTFYYHFKDKYDLVAWIYLQDYKASLEETGGVFSLQLVEGMLERMKKNQSFYRKAFSDKSQNTISHSIYELFLQLGVEAALAYTGGEKLSPEDLYSIKSYIFACVGHTREWLDGVTSYSPRDFALLQYASLPEILKKAYGAEEIHKKESKKALSQKGIL